MARQQDEKDKWTVGQRIKGKNIKIKHGDNYVTATLK